MDRNEWWRFIGIGRPVSLPEKLEKVPFLMGYHEVADYTRLLNDVLFYHFLLGKSLGVSAKSDIGFAYFLARLITVLIFVGALFVFYSLFRRPALNPGQAGETALFGSGFLFILFLPQFIVAACAVNPDSVSIFVGAVFFYMAFSILMGKQRVGALTGLFFAAVCGSVMDRSNLSLIPLSFLVILLGVGRKNWRKTLALILVFIGAFAALYFAFHLFLPAQIEKVLSNAKSYLSRASFGEIFSLSPMNRIFLRGLMDSFLLKFGWSAYESIPIAYFIWKIFLAISGLGIVFWSARAVIAKRKGRETASIPEDALIVGTSVGARLPRMVFFSLTAAFLQILAIRLVATPDNLYIQGRYLFALIAPLAFLFVFGLKEFFDAFSKKAELGALVLKAFLIFEFFFLNYALWHDIIPVFHLTLKSAHAGV